MRPFASIPVVLAAVSGAPALSAPIQAGGAAADFRDVVAAAKSKVFPTVVYIRVVREATEQGKKGLQQVSGSGAIIGAGGEVLTNWHVVEKAQSVRCLLSDGRPMPATVVGSDQDTDLALLQLQVPAGSEPLPFADFGESAGLQEGDFVMAMGAPFGLNRSVSIGIVSCSRRYLEGASEYSLWLQTDAAINPGNSGGPLVGTDGRIVGVNARGMGRAEGMGFAIPVETVRELLPHLREHGRMQWSWTGLQLQALQDFNREIYFDETTGVIVAATDPDSPARGAGLQPRDRIVRVNGAPLVATTEEDLPAARRRLALLPRGTAALLEVARGEEKIDIELVPSEKGAVQGQELVCQRWDLTVKSINRFDNADLHFHRPEGVFVYGLKHPGNASTSGLRPQDIIVSIDGREVTTLDELRQIYDESLAAIDQRHRLLVSVLRNGLSRQVVLDFARDYSRQ